MKLSIRIIQQHLFDDPDMGIYAVIDGASVLDLLDALHEHRPEYACLLGGDLTPDMAEVAPYVVRLQAETPFFRWLLDRWWGRHFGVFAAASSDLRSVRRHFKSLLTAYDPQGRPVFFRYYDPRVLGAYLPTCNEQETRLFFGPISWFPFENDQGASLSWYEPAGALPRQQVWKVASDNGKSEGGGIWR